ncbi:MAG: hypothetical protein OEY66_10980 [Gammaproteobacteria bacterium]|nr:hypothetical protein [Gammaproteobacteria bacterium]
MKSYQKIKFLQAAGILSLLFFNATTANAGLCDGFTGKALGLCMAYTAGMKCNTEEPSGNDAACARIEQNLVETTGEPLPWTCPAFTSESIVFAYQSNADSITNVDFVNRTAEIDFSDLSMIAFHGSEPWYQYFSGLSVYIQPGDYMAVEQDHTGVDNKVTLSQAQSDACRVEAKEAYATIKNIACPNGGTYPSSCTTRLDYCDAGISETNVEQDPDRIIKPGCGTHTILLF